MAGIYNYDAKTCQSSSATGQEGETEFCEQLPPQKSGGSGPQVMQGLTTNFFQGKGWLGFWNVTKKIGGVLRYMQFVTEAGDLPWDTGYVVILNILTLCPTHIVKMSSQNVLHTLP